MTPWEVVATAGIWNSPAFRGYVDLKDEAGQCARKLFPVDLESESDCELS